MLYRILKDGHVPVTLEISEASSHHIAKWLFLSPVFAKTAKPLKLLPIAIAILLVGAFGTAYANLDPALFFYFPYSTYSLLGIMALYIFNWMGLFFFAELFTYLLYRRVGNDLQLFTCIGIAAFLLAIYPYIYLAIPIAFSNFTLAETTMISQYILIVLQIFSLLLVSAAFSFGKGIRLDKSFVISLTALYINITILFVLGRLT
jgi:hypothetical protein